MTTVVYYVTDSASLHAVEDKVGPFFKSKDFAEHYAKNLAQKANFERAFIVIKYNLRLVS